MGATVDFQAGVMSALEAWKQANFPNIDLVGDNAPVPQQDRITSPWIEVEIRPYDAGQVALGSPFRGRELGVVSVRVYTRQGEGTAVANAIKDSLKQALSGARDTGWRLGHPKPYTPTTLSGWNKRGLMFPYWLET